jgi:hypothetical protein
MTTLGLCTHFNQTDDWAFEYAFKLVRENGWQLNICHWLHSPYLLRCDMVEDDLFGGGETQPVTPGLLNKLELQLRQYYDERLGDFTDVAFKLCEGHYQVELVRCFRSHLLDVVIMGYQQVSAEAGAQPLEAFAYKLAYPLIIVGRDGPESFLLNSKALELQDRLDLTGYSWQILQPLAVTF